MLCRAEAHILKERALDGSLSAALELLADGQRYSDKEHRKIKIELEYEFVDTTTKRWYEIINTIMGDWEFRKSRIV